MNKKNVKSKSKLTEEQKREKIAAALKRKKECEKKALAIVTRLTEETLTQEWLMQSLVYINQDYYDDIVEERSIVKMCGYPTCDSTIQNIKMSKYRISVRDKKVYDVEERSKFCSGFCYQASTHLKKQLDSSPLWIREDRPATKVNFLQLASGNNKNTIHSGKGEEVELVVRARPPPDDEADRQVVVLQNLDSEDITITDITSGDQLYSTSESKSKEGDSNKKSILKKTSEYNTTNEDIDELCTDKQVKFDNESKQRHKVRFNSNYTGLQESVCERTEEGRDPLDLFQENLDTATAGELVAAVKQMKLDTQRAATPSSGLISTAVKEIQKRRVDHFDERSSSEVVLDTLLAWFTPGAVKLLKGQPEHDTEDDTNDTDGEDEEEEDGENGDSFNTHTKNNKSARKKDTSQFHVDPELVRETEILSNKFASFLKGKETWENPEVQEVEDDRPEPSLPLLDRHAQFEHRVRIVLDQLSRYGAPIYELLGLPTRSLQAVLKDYVKLFALKAENIALKPVEWRITSICLSHMLVEKSEDLRQVARTKQYHKNLQTLIEEFNLEPQFLSHVQQRICDHSRFLNK